MTYRVVVYHDSYGCDTGCCGHYVSVNDRDIGHIDFGHPYSDDPEDFKKYAIELARDRVESEYGPGHTVDLDWENCRVSND